MVVCNATLLLYTLFFSFSEQERSRKLVELNVVEQCLNVYKTGVVQRRRLETSKDDDCEFAYPRVHAVVFDPCDGKLIKLPVSFKNEIKKFSHVYVRHGNRYPAGI